MFKIKTKTISLLLAIIALLAIFSACSYKPESDIKEPDVKTLQEETVGVTEDTEEQEDEEIPFDKIREVSSPELELNFIGDAVKNGYYYATLNKYEKTDDGITFQVETSMKASEIKYKIYEDDEGKTLAYTGTAGLSYATQGNKIYDVTLSYNIFTDDQEDLSEEINPEWKDLPKKFFIESGLDTNVIVNLDIR